MSALTIDTEVTTDSVGEYSAHYPRFSEGWQQFAQTVLEELSSSHNPRAIEGESTTQHQINLMASAVHTTFSDKEAALYLNLRTTTAQIPLAAEEIGAEPRKLTDQRLMIEICLLTGDCRNAIALIEQFPTVKAA